MTWLDAILLFVLLIGLIRGCMKGIIIELTAILAVIIGIVGVRLWSHEVAVWFVKQFSWNMEIARVIAGIVLFIGIALVLTIIGRLLTRLMKAIHLGMINRILGGVFGAIKYAIVLLFAVWCTNKLDLRLHFLDQNLKTQSVVYTTTVQAADRAETLSVVHR